ncbi:HigA family addiction module antitoxin [Pantoea sp. CCBC3-3-1]|uniref:HigA family addiction module antitoxin n=1 Tax=Pantoea sp. CCBC3-3-1 TaxID=2490851 RepID=UPI0011BE521D|nr:HigA family addiction module antitoxin [Pantoea sp. CCBC3-3-1]
MTVQHPGNILRKALEDEKMSLAAAAEKIGVTKATLSRLINQKQSLTPELAIKISILCRKHPLVLLTCQNEHDLARLGWEG